MKEEETGRDLTHMPYVLEPPFRNVLVMIRVGGGLSGQPWEDIVAKLNTVSQQWCCIRFDPPFGLLKSKFRGIIEQ